MERNDSIIEDRTEGLVHKDELRTVNYDNISTLTSMMLNTDHYHQMLDVVEEQEVDDFSSFNDIEMIYFFVHQEKDQDERKNRSEDTKREYVRELLWIYILFKDYGEMFDFDTRDLTDQSLLQSIGRKQIRKFQEWLRKAPLGKGGKPYSVATISRKTGIFKSLLRFLYEKEYLTHPIHESFKSANIHDRDRPNRDISSQEVIQLLDYFQKHPIIHGLLSVLVTTGMRVRELCTAKVSDLSYEDGLYWLEVLGKGNETREVLIHPNVFDTIV